MSANSIIGISSSACFYPEEDDPENFDGSTITWTFEVHKSVQTGPGLYRLELIRMLTPEERTAKSATLLASDAQPTSAIQKGRK